MTDDTSGTPVQEYKPRKPKYNGWVILNRRKPFELFLKFGGGIFFLHFQIYKLTITWDAGRKK